MKRSKQLFFVGVFLTLALFPALYSFGRLLIGGDIIVPLNLEGLEKYLYQWVSLGNGVYFSHYYFPYYLIYYILISSGFNVYYISAILLVSLNTIGGLGIYKICKLFTTNKFSFDFVFPVIFFLLSPALLNIWHYAFIYFFSPWIIYYIVKFILKKKILWKDVFTVFIVLFFCTMDLPNPKYVFHLILITTVSFVTAIYIGLLPLRFFKENLKKFLVLLLALSYLFIPLGNFVLNYSPDSYGVKISSSYSDSRRLPDYKTTTADKMLQLHHDNVYLNSDDKSAYINNPLVQVASYVFFAVIIMNLLLQEKEMFLSKYNSLFFTLTIFYLFFAFGPNPPLGFLYERIVRGVSLMAFLRTTAGAPIFLSIFFSVQLYIFLVSLKAYKNYIYMLLLLSLACVASPLIFGQYYENQNYIGNSFINENDYGHTIPKSYYAIKEYLDSNSFDGKVLNLNSNLSYTDHSWGYFGANIYSFLFKSYLTGYDKVYTTLANHNIKYIFEDLSVLYPPKSIIDDLSLYKLVAQSEYLKLYEIPKNQFLPHFYIPQQSIAFNGSAAILSKFSKTFNTVPRTEYFVIGDKNDISNSSVFSNADNIILSANRRNFAINENYTEWDKGWAWPDANTNPESIKYHLVKLREKIDFLRQEIFHDKLDSVDLLIWFSAKRTEEVSRYNIDSESALGKMLVDQYKQNIEDILEILKGSYTKTSDDIYWGTVRKFLVYTRKSNEILLSKGYLTKDDSQYFVDLEDFSDWVYGSLNISCKDYCYSIKPEVTANYNVLISKNDIEKLDTDTFSIKVDGEELNTPDQLDTDYKLKDWYVFNQKSFDVNRVHTIELTLPESENLIDSDSWKNQLETEINQNNFYNNIKSWSASTKYKISFDYSVSKGDLGVSIVENVTDYDSSYNSKRTDFDSSKNNIIPRTKKVTFREVVKPKDTITLEERTSDIGYDFCNYSENDICFSHYEHVITSDPSADSAQVYLYSLPNVSEESVVKIANFKIQYYLDPLVLLSMNNPKPKVATPDISFIKINPTKYKVAVKNGNVPYHLVFSESFHKDWKLYLNPSSKLKETKVVESYFGGEINLLHPNNSAMDKAPFETLFMTEVSEDKHYIANAYANGWVINPEDIGNMDDYELIVEFKPQRVFYISAIITLVSLAVVILLVIYENIHIKYSQKQ